MPALGWRWRRGSTGYGGQDLSDRFAESGDPGWFVPFMLESGRARRAPALAASPEPLHSFILRALTLMATLEYLSGVGRLIRHEPDLEHDDQPNRFACFAPPFVAWLKTELKASQRDRSQITPFEQVEQALYEFVLGRPLEYKRHYRKLKPHLADIWELKTKDVRLFGWVPRLGCFVVVCGRMKKELRRPEGYDPFIQAAREFRDALDLDPPKAIQGVTIDAVF